MKFSPQQETALTKVSNFLKSSDQVFYLAGFAGTGKTTLAKHFAQDYDTLFAAYTGKASLCLTKAGCTPSSTIHSILYRPMKDKMKKISELEKQLNEGAGNSADLRTELNELKKPQFMLRDDSPIEYADLLVLDECSMIDEAMAKDAMSFGTKILVLGDPMQLPPVKGTGFFTAKEPDYLLTEIHRQAKENPIIALSMHVREHGYIPANFAENAKRIGRSQLTPDMARDASQIMAGKNDTRRLWNKRMRKAYGRVSDYPEVGEKLIALRNNQKRGILNGMFAEVQAVHGDPHEFACVLDIETELQGKLKELEVYSITFDEYKNADAGKSVPYFIQKQRELFDYGYCITVHKSQGSQFDHVLLVDDGFLSWKQEERKRWLYTAVTRAVESIIVV